MSYVVAIFLILAVLLGPVVLVPIVLVGAILKAIPAALYVMALWAYVPFAVGPRKFLAKPRHVVIPCTLAWGVAIGPLLFWLNQGSAVQHPASELGEALEAGERCPVRPRADDPFAKLNLEERAYLTGCTLPGPAAAPQPSLPHKQQAG